MQESSRSWLRWSALGAVLGAALTLAGYTWMGRGPLVADDPDAADAARAALARAEAGAHARADAGGGSGSAAALRAGASPGFAEPVPLGSEAGSSSRGGEGAAFEATGTGRSGQRVGRRGPLDGAGGGGIGDPGRSGIGSRLDPDADAEADEEIVAEPEDEVPDDPADAFDVAALGALERAAAQAAASLQLLTPQELQRRIDERVGSAQADTLNLAQAREQARIQILADEALIVDLLRSRYPDPDQAQQAQQARPWLETLMPGWTPEFRARRLTGIAERLGS